MKASVDDKYKGFTSLEQSKQLMKLGIRIIRKADMHYWETTNGKTIGKLSNTPNIGFDSNFYYGTDNGKTYHYLPCWSLSSLLDVLKDKITFGGNSPEGWFCCYTIKSPTKLVTIYGDSLVDACYKTILNLYELKML